MIAQPVHSQFRLVETDITTSQRILPFILVKLPTLTLKLMEKPSVQLMRTSHSLFTVPHHAVRLLTLLKVKSSNDLYSTKLLLFYY